ncbi:Hypothetical predicted protein [Octopus vulgaris]|uniref:Uncharacterized protein n=1 Tax=Octopus vulgaris TaxID=6645 RepID=A0AA36FM12_OCTVU|nr:Hypothetical predicted protein [Octopus vulgaris]
MMMMMITRVSRHLQKPRALKLLEFHKRHSYIYIAGYLPFDNTTSFSGLTSFVYHYGTSWKPNGAQWPFSQGLAALCPNLV